MPLIFPNLSVEYLQFFFACARLESPPRELIDWVNGLDSDYVEASYDSVHGKSWILANCNFVDDSEEDDENDEQPYVHFYISCAIPSFFGGEKDDDEPTHSQEQFEEFCSHFLGEQLALVRLMSKFIVPETELPEVGVANLLGTKATVGGEKVALDTVAARFLDSEAPHKTIQWEQESTGDSIIIRLRSTIREVTVTDNYLVNCQDLLSGALDQIILEKEDVDGKE